MLILFFGLNEIRSQNLWTLSKCIDIAISENITIKQQKLNSKIAKNNFTQSKFSFLPDLNAYGSHRFNYGRSINPITNDFTIENIRSNNFSLTSSIIIFEGFKKNNTLQKNKYELLSSKKDVEKTINDISLSIANLFLQVLFAEEMLQVAIKQVEISKLQIERIKKMISAGSLAKGQLLEVESQKLAEDLQVINYTNQLNDAYLNLKQIIEIKENITFKIHVPNITIEEELSFPSADEIYKFAVKSFPEIKSAEYQVKISEKKMLIAKSSYSPALALNTSIGTNYSSINNDLYSNNNGSFKDQLSDNFSQAVTLSLNIPIFNNWQTNSAVALSKIDLQFSKNNLLQQKNELRKQIEKALADVKASKKQYEFSKKSLELFNDAYIFSEKRYTLGLINSFEYNNSKNKLFKAKSEKIRSKFDYIFKMKIIDFYLGKKLNI